jgi:hypothetical protein
VNDSATVTNAQDWTLKKYEHLCHEICSSEYQVQRLGDYLREPAGQCIMLRHDVDRVPGNALKMAKLEHSLGLKSTYYVRKVPAVYSDSLVRSLHGLGHEVGYHYEVLSKTNGKLDAALKLFESELSELRQLAPIQTASSHGSPLSPWDSLDLWQHVSPESFGLLGEAYRSIDYAQVGYYTDTGRTWATTRTNLRDRVANGSQSFPLVTTTDELIGLVRSQHCQALCIQTHPERWNSDIFGHIRSLLFDSAANLAKLAIYHLRSDRVRS